MTKSNPNLADDVTDYLTVVALSLLAYTLTVLLHEHFGHALACLALGGRPVELGAFYVDCQYADMPDLSIRLVALAGPLVSLVTGAVGLLVVDRLPKAASHLRYWAWLFGTISLMTATGYLLFSGVTGLGDIGTSRSGALYLARPEWIWRGASIALGGAGYAAVIYLSLGRFDQLIGGEGAARVKRAQKLALTSYLLNSPPDGALYLARPQWIWRGASVVLGSASYAAVIYLSLRKIDKFIGGEGAARVRHAQKLALTSYFSGALMSVLIGLLNPIGFVIVLISAAASTLGGTSGLAWMMQLLNRKKALSTPALRLERNWSWVLTGFIVALLYAVILGPTVRPYV